jgi:hypothetical protein
MLYPQRIKLVPDVCPAYLQPRSLGRSKQNEKEKQMKINNRVSYSFTKLSDAAIADFTDVIINGLTGNAGFPTLPVPLATLGTQKADYLVKLAAAADGGKLATAEKNEARAVLEESLRQLAAYVQSLANNDLTLLLSSGFQPVSTNRAQSPLEKPVVLNIDNQSSTKFTVRVQPVVNARAYEAQYKNGGGWLPAGVFTNSRRIEIGDLTPGTSYTVQIRAVGGSTGYSDWSAPQPCIAT